MRAGWLMIVTAAAALGACTVGPSYVTPRIAVEGSYLADGMPGGAELARWWEGLGDPVLTQLVEGALEKNLDLKLAMARIREARAERAAVFGLAEPTLNADGGFSHQRFSQNAAPFNAFDVPNFPWEFNLFQLGFDASWEVDLFGGTRRGVEAANAALEATEEDRRGVQVTLLGEIGRNYVEMRGFQEQQAIAQRNLAGQRETLALTKDRVAKGVGTQLDVARAAAQVAETEAQVPVFERGEWQAIHRLAVLTHQGLAEVTYLHETGGAAVAAPEAVVAGVPGDLLRRRPDIRKAERLLAAATARIGVAEADLYPRLSITGAFNLQSASVEDLFAWRSRAFSIGPTVNWPIFEAGRLRAVVAVRNAQAEGAMATYEESVEKAIAEVRDELVAISTERARRKSLTEAVAAHQESVDLAKQLYGQGLTDFLNVLDAQRDLFVAQDALSQSGTRVTESVIGLYKALGGGWEVK